MKLTTKRKGKVIGFVTWKRVGKPKHKLIELTRIEVKPKYRSEGIATELFNRMLNKIEFRKLFLTCHYGNTIARKFYMTMGMSYETSLENHYYKGEPECVYSMFRK